MIHIVDSNGREVIAAAQSGSWTVAATQSGTWDVGTVSTVTAVTSITNAVAVTDNSGSLTVDAPVGTPVFVRLSDGSSAISTLPVSLASVPSHAVTQSGTWNFNLSQYGGSSVSSSNAVYVQAGAGAVFAASQSGTWNIGTVASIGSAVQVTDAGGSLTVDDGGTTLSVDDGGSSLTVDGTVAATQSGSWSVTVSGTAAVTQSGTWNITTVSDVSNAVCQGRAAHDTTISGSPLPIGGYAKATAPTAVDSDGDVVHAWFDLNGRLQIGDGGGSLTVDGTVAATQSGTWNVGTVTTVSTITNTVHVDDNSGSLTVDAPVGTPVFVRLSDGSSAIATLPVSLASVPSHAVTNAGTFAVQVDGSALTSLQLIDDIVHSGDASLSKYAVIGAVFDDTSTATVTENNAHSLRMSSRRALLVEGVSGGTAMPVSIAATVTVDTELPAAGALSDALSNPTSPLVGSCELLWDSANSQWLRRPAMCAGTLLTSASRSATVNSASQTNRGCKGVIAWLNISVFNGGTGMDMTIEGQDPVSGNWSDLANMTNRSGTVRPHTLELCPGSGSASTPSLYGVRAEGHLPDVWRVKITHATATAHTYSVGYTLLPG